MFVGMRELIRFHNRFATLRFANDISKYSRRAQ
jgi:hypothetical protein